MRIVAFYVVLQALWMGSAFGKQTGIDFVYNFKFNYKDKNGTSTKLSSGCNGVALEKAERNGSCYYILLSARHCVQSEPRIERGGDFGKDYVLEIRINDHKMVAKEYLDANAKTDAVLVELVGSCEAVPNKYVADFSYVSPEVGDTVYIRKSSFWKDAVIEQPNGQRVSYAHHAGKQLSAKVVGIDGRELRFSATSVELIPGDSGMPVTNAKGEVVAVFSARIEEKGRLDFYSAALSPKMKEMIQDKLAEFRKRFNLED